MSFSSEVKEELSKINNLKNKDEVAFELVGYLITSNIEEKAKYIEYSTENEYNINRLNKLLNNMNIDYEIRIQGNVYIIKFKKEKIIKIQEEKLSNINKDELNDNLKRAFIRGTFLGSGSINDPNKTYHLEIVLKTEEYANILEKVSLNMGINFKRLQRKNSYSLYLKDGEEISKLFALIGASKAVLKYEEIRVIRDMRNNINRKVNCETANLNKTVSAAVRQIEDIKFLSKHNVKLPENLKEIAELRIENPDVSLIELGKMLKEPIGKSGVNHRLKKIQSMAEELRGNK